MIDKSSNQEAAIVKPRITVGSPSILWQISCGLPSMSCTNPKVIIGICGNLSIEGVPYVISYINKHAIFQFGHLILQDSQYINQTNDLFSTG